MRIKILYFTDKGKALAEQLKEGLPDHDAVIVPKGVPLAFVCGDAFADNEALLFVGAAGIAVRAISPFVRDKLTDPPVLDIDENGNFVIPILSGHVGGANSLAFEIAGILGAQPVITTATDVSGAFSVDLFAKENDLRIVNREGIAKVSSSALEGKAVTICIKDYPPQNYVDVLVTDESALKDSASIVLCPRKYAVGIGCRKGKPFDEIRNFAESVLTENGIIADEIGAIAIDARRASPEHDAGFKHEAILLVALRGGIAETEAHIRFESLRLHRGPNHAVLVGFQEIVTQMDAHPPVGQHVLVHHISHFGGNVDRNAVVFKEQHVVERVPGVVVSRHHLVVHAVVHVDRIERCDVLLPIVCLGDVL